MHHKTNKACPQPLNEWMQSNHNYKPFIASPPLILLPTTLKPAVLHRPPGKKACSISVSLNPEVSMLSRRQKSNRHQEGCSKPVCAGSGTEIRFQRSEWWRRNLGHGFRAWWRSCLFISAVGINVLMVSTLRLRHADRESGWGRAVAPAVHKVALSAMEPGRRPHAARSSVHPADKYSIGN